MSISINGTSGLTFNDASTQNTAATGFGFKNRLINSDMRIDQRNAGAEVNPAVNGAYYTDRWNVLSTQTSKFKIGQNAGSVTPPTGFTNYLGITSLSAYSVTSTDVFEVRQNIEGLNFADMGWGAAGAATVTVSFWVRSSLTGTFGGALQNTAYTRSYPFSYTISAANTWELKSITIAGDTTGTWLKTNDTGVRVVFGLGVGSTYSGTAGAWAASELHSATGATSVVGTNGATFYITGVQLEKGSTATSFDYRPYGTELALCQRYYYRLNTANENGNYTIFGWGHAYGTGVINATINLPVSMRAYPTTLDTSAMSTFQYETGSTSGTTPTSIAINVGSNSTWMGSIDVNKSASFTNAASYKLQAANTKTAYIGFGAEL